VVISGAAVPGHQFQNFHQGWSLTLPSFGSIAGAFFGGLIIGIVQTACGFFFSPNYKEVFVFALYLLVVFWRPHGLLGRR